MMPRENFPSNKQQARYHLPFTLPRSDSPVGNLAGFKTNFIEMRDVPRTDGLVGAETIRILFSMLERGIGSKLEPGCIIRNKGKQAKVGRVVDNVDLPKPVLQGDLMRSIAVGDLVRPFDSLIKR